MIYANPFCQNLLLRQKWSRHLDHGLHVPWQPFSAFILPFAALLVVPLHEGNCINRRNAFSIKHLCLDFPRIGRAFLDKGKLATPY